MKLVIQNRLNTINVKEYFLTLILILSSGCIENFNYHPGSDDSGLLVIDGGMTNLPVKQFLKLTRSTAYGTTSFVPDTGDSVTVFENGKEADICTEISPGIYQIDGDEINPQPGNSYFIKISLQNGKHYISEPEIMPWPVKPDRAGYEMDKGMEINDLGYFVEHWMINVYVNTPVKAGDRPAFLRWRVPETFSIREMGSGPLAHPKTCYATRNLTSTDIVLFDGGNLSGGELKHQLIYRREPKPDVEFINVHYFNIYQYSITRAAYVYWNKLKIVSNPTGSFLDTNPGVVTGNVYNIHDRQETVLGYFEVSSVEIVHLKCVPSSLLPYHVHDPCADYPFPSFCLECLDSLLNSSLDRPSYW